jgi:hypothetical protein
VGRLRAPFAIDVKIRRDQSSEGQPAQIVSAQIVAAQISG